MVGRRLGLARVWRFDQVGVYYRGHEPGNDCGIGRVTAAGRWCYIRDGAALKDMAEAVGLVDDVVAATNAGGLNTDNPEVGRFNSAS